MADEVRLDVGARILDRIANARLRAEMDDPVELLAGKRAVQRLVIGEIHLLELEAAGIERGERGQPVGLEARIVIGVEAVDADHRIRPASSGAGRRGSR